MKPAKLTEIMDWLQKAEWLRKQGYNLNIYSLEAEGDKWFVILMAKTSDERRRYSPSIEDVVNQIYDEIRATKQND